MKRFFFRLHSLINNSIVILLNGQIIYICISKNKNEYLNMKLLEGKVAIITGASRGIGKGIAEVFAKHGANVAFTYSSSAASAEALEAELNGLGVKAKGYQSNAADFNEAQAFVDAVLVDFGTVDILINNAGITKDNLLMRMSEADFDQVIDVNLKSVFNMTKAIQKTFLKQRAGSIINISSVVGVSGNAGQTNYAASKAGAIGFTKSVALELGSRNIRCNAIAPGFIETEMTAKLPEDVVKGWREGIPLKRGGTTEDVANACLFLASDMSAYVTGQVLNVCGGMLT
ncbi:3-oxoacyl-[acyl-carrier-protein] reductase [Flavobacterium resistens]|uniref:3-oxoacyl-[acyl-carrier-protein] reductase n=2 Tax=Flavobacterium resistens TaxID=443612 RepID=A0A521AK52_9FLAO|nr:3-oxoacyl-[acyl-carrier-protein] reductase [Flavobacterium resistens]